MRTDWTGGTRRRASRGVFPLAAGLLGSACLVLGGVLATVLLAPADARGAGQQQLENRTPPREQPGAGVGARATDPSRDKKKADLPPVERRIIVSDDGLENLTFATPCEPGLLASAVAGATVEPLPDREGAAGGAVYEVRRGWEPLYLAEEHPGTGHIDRLIVWSGNALTPAGITIGQSFERASRRKRSSWSFEPGQGEFRGALVGTNADESHLHYVFAPVTWSAGSDATGTLSEPQPHWEIKAFIWTSY